MEYWWSRTRMYASRTVRHAFALSLTGLLLVAPAALAEPGDLTGAGCLRDLENTLTGCQSVQGLDRGYGVAVSPDGKQVYVAAADDDTLTTFNRDPQTGAVTWIGCLRDDGRAAVGCTTVAGLDGARGIAVSPDGKSVYVASGDGDALAVFNRSTTSGALMLVGCSRDTENPLAGCTQVQGLDAPRDVSITADGTSVYEASAEDDAVTFFRRSTSTGALTWVSCVRDVSNAGTGCASAIGIDGPRAADLSPDGTSLYVAARDGDSVAEFDRNTTTGALTWRGCFRDVENTITGCTSVQGLDGPHGISLSPDGTSVYFPTESDDTVTTFARNTTSGALTYGGCIGDIGVAPPGCASAEGLNGSRDVKVSGDGTNVYVAAADDDAVVVFDRDAATGALTWDSCTRDADRPSANQCALAQGLDGVRGLASSEDGTSVYAVSELDDALVVFNRELAPDTTAPTVGWKTPAEGQLVWGTLTEANGGCTITAADDRVLDRVEVLLDGAPLSRDTTAPYGCDWDTTTTPNGSHTLTRALARPVAALDRVTRLQHLATPSTVQALPGLCR